MRALFSLSYSVKSCSRFLRRSLLAAVPGLLLLALAASGALAQGRANMTGQILLPNGAPVGEVTQFELHSGDPRRPVEIYHTDSHGRIRILGLASGTWHKIVVQSDGWRYDRTEFEFMPAAGTRINIMLAPLREEKMMPPKGDHTISVTTPGAQAQRAYEEGVELARQGKTAEARSSLERAVRLAPGMVEAYGELAELAFRERDYAHAESFSRRAVENIPRGPDGWLTLGVALNYQKRYSEAIAALRQALALQADWPAAQAYLGIALLEDEQAEAARPCLLLGVNAEGAASTFAYLYLGKLHAMSQEAPDAIRAWEAYLERDPDSVTSAQIRKLVAHLREQSPGNGLRALHSPAPCR